MLNLARHAMSFYPDAPRKVRCHNAVRWARSIQILGGKWILNQKVLRSAK